MMTQTHITKWAYKQSSVLLAPLETRWLHVQGVVKRAQWVGSILNEDDRSLLVAAAYLHDIGYVPSLAKTGFHPLDGAVYMQSLHELRLASLVAYHSGAQFEAHLRGLGPSLQIFPYEHSLLMDALTYCDMTTNSRGQQVTFQERIDDIFSRYDKKHIVHQAISQAIPFLSQAIERTEQMLHQYGTSSSSSPS